jgi:hypothetical protein
MERFMDDALPTIAVHCSISGRLRSMAAGRSLEIGYFQSNRCGSRVGDLTMTWRLVPPGDSHVALIPVEGVSVFADRRLLEVLRRGAPELRLGGWLDRKTPSLWLGVPETWIDFLDCRLQPAMRSAIDPVQPRTPVA